MHKSFFDGRNRTPQRMFSMRAFTVLLIVSLLVPVGVFAAPSAAPEAAPSSFPLTEKVIFFAADGMRPDMVEDFVADGSMPTYAALMASGVRGDNGMVQAFPPNTGVGWYTMATGTYPGEHGSTNNTFFRQGEPNFNNRTSLGNSILQADTLQQAAERAGKKVASVEWVGSRTHNLLGPVIDFRNFFSGLQRRKVRRRAGGEHIDQCALEVGVTGTGSNGAAHRGEIQFEGTNTPRAAGNINQLDIEAGGLTCTGTDQAIRARESNIEPITHS